MNIDAKITMNCEGRLSNFGKSIWCDRFRDPAPGTQKGLAIPDTTRRVVRKPKLRSTVNWTERPDYLFIAIVALQFWTFSNINLIDYL